MDNTVIVALISAIASILTAVVTPLLGQRATTGAASAKHPLRSRRTAIAAFLFGILVAVVAGATFSLVSKGPDTSFQQNSLLPGAKFNAIASNGNITLKLDADFPKLPPDIPIYGLDAPGGGNQRAVSGLTLKQTLTYKSNLRSREGFTICQFMADKPVSHDAATGIRLVLWAQEDDLVELDLKDEWDIEEKPMLPIHRGWGAYEIPFKAFGRVNRSSVKEFHIACTPGKNGRETNVIRIGMISTYE